MLEYPRFRSDRIKLDTVGKQTCRGFARGMDVRACDLSARNQQYDLPVMSVTFSRSIAAAKTTSSKTRLTSPGLLLVLGFGATGVVGRVTSGGGPLVPICVRSRIPRNGAAPTTAPGSLSSGLESVQWARPGRSSPQVVANRS